MSVSCGLCVTPKQGLATYPLRSRSASYIWQWGDREVASLLPFPGPPPSHAGLCKARAHFALGPHRCWGRVTAALETLKLHSRA